MRAPDPYPVRGALRACVAGHCHHLVKLDTGYTCAIGAQGAGAQAIASLSASLVLRMAYRATLNC